MRKKAAILLLCLTWSLTGCNAASTEDPDLAEIIEKMEVTDTASGDGGAQDSASDAGETGTGISGYPSLEGKETAFTVKSFSDVFTSIEQKENRLYYIGFPGCDWCQSMVAILNEAALEAGKEIWYVPLRDEQGNEVYEMEDRERFVEFAQEHLDTNDEGEPTLFSPYVFVLKDGEIIDSRVGTLEDHKLEEGMTAEQEQELLDIYKAMFQEVE